MLRAQGASVGDVAVQEIEVFLKDTEEYLNRCAPAPYLLLNSTTALPGS